jgi:hypothetical protein
MSITETGERNMQLANRITKEHSSILITLKREAFSKFLPFI